MAVVMLVVVLVSFSGQQCRGTSSAELISFGVLVEC